jgi:hypothetical protein
MRVPQSCNAHIVMRFEAVEETRGLPIPNEEFSISVTRNQVTETTECNNFMLHN